MRIAVTNLARRHNYPLEICYSFGEEVIIVDQDQPRIVSINGTFYNRNRSNRIALQYRISEDKFHSFTGEIKFTDEVKDKRALKKRDEKRGRIEMLLLEHGIQPETRVLNPSKITITRIKPKSFEGVRRFLSAYFQIQRELGASSHHH